MTGYVEWSDVPCRGGVCYRNKEICGVYFYAAMIFKGEKTPELLLHRRLKKAAKALRHRGVSYAVFPEGFSCTEIFAECGVLPVEMLPLCRALAPELAWSAARNCGISPAAARIAVCGDHLTSELAWTVTQLCMRSRYILLAAPDHEGTFCRRLRREYGVALVQTEDAVQIAEADICVLFSPREDLQTTHAVLRLYRNAALPSIRLRVLEEKERIPPACNQIQMIAALYAAGVIQREQISVEMLPNASGTDTIA